MALRLPRVALRPSHVGLRPPHVALRLLHSAIVGLFQRQTSERPVSLVLDVKRRTLMFDL